MWVQHRSTVVVVARAERGAWCRGTTDYPVRTQALRVQRHPQYSACKGESSRGFVYYEVPVTDVLATNTTFASPCIMNHYYESQTPGTAIGPLTYQGICHGSSTYTGYSTNWTPPNCLFDPTAWRQTWKFSP